MRYNEGYIRALTDKITIEYHLQFVILPKKDTSFNFVRVTTPCKSYRPNFGLRILVDWFSYTTSLTDDEQRVALKICYEVDTKGSDQKERYSNNNDKHLLEFLFSPCSSSSLLRCSAVTFIEFLHHHD